MNESLKIELQEKHSLMASYGEKLENLRRSL